MNYRPILNRPFISKLVEKLEAMRVEEYLEHKNLHDNYQFIYHNFVQQKLLSWKCSVILVKLLMKDQLIMFDLFTGFDVIDHPILLKRLEISFDIKEKTLTWVKLTAVKHHQMYDFVLG